MACLTPRTTPLGYVVQCGYCPACRLARVQSWCFRVMQEYKRHSAAHFVTLTYANGECERSTNGFLTLTKRHVQLYMKLLRYDHYLKYGFYPFIKYYAVGEYGGKSARPHYHLILFGCDESLIADAWRTKDGCVRGGTFIGTCTPESVAYVMKYISKPRKFSAYGRDDRIKEFSLKSKGLGNNYLTPQMVAYHRADLTRNYVTQLGGVKVSMPRYYKDKIFTPDDKLVIRDLMQSFSQRKSLEARKKHQVNFGTDVGYELAIISRKKRRLGSDFEAAQLNRNVL